MRAREPACARYERAHYEADAAPRYEANICELARVMKLMRYEARVMKPIPRLSCYEARVMKLPHSGMFMKFITVLIMGLRYVMKLISAS